MADLFSPLSAGPLAPQPASHGKFFGEDPLPADFQSLRSEVPDLTRTADALKGYGGGFVSSGAEALGRAQRGELTGPQQAELGQYRTGLTNQARQMFYGMGRAPDKDTAFISQTADIDAKVNAMAQQQIQSTIALGLGEVSAGGNFFGQSLGFDQAAMNALVQAGQAQLHQDEAYRKQLSEATSSIFKMFGSIGGSVLGGIFGGPAGAAAGGAVGGAIGGELDSSYGGSPESNVLLSPSTYGNYA